MPLGGKLDQMKDEQLLKPLEMIYYVKIPL